MQNAEAVEIWKRRFITDFFYSQRKHRCLDSTDSEGGGWKPESIKQEMRTSYNHPANRDANARDVW